MSSRAGTLPPQQLSAILKLLPDVQYAFGYGSGVFRQPNLYEAGNQPLLDFIVAVEDPAAWHALVSKPLTAAVVQPLPMQHLRQQRQRPCDPYMY